MALHKEYKDPEVERFYKFWQVQDELERKQREQDYENKRNGKLSIQRKGK